MWLILLILGFAGGLLVAYWWGRPMRLVLAELHRNVRRAGTDHAQPLHDLERTAGLVRRDTRDSARHVRELATLLHQRDAAIGRVIRSLDRQRGDLETLVDALPDPILLADTRRRLILINSPAAALLGVPKRQALHQSIERVVNEPAMLALFDQTAKIELGERHADERPKLPLRRDVRLGTAAKPLRFQAVATRSQAGGVLLVLRDISTLDQTLRMKADFVANAGHELRTPVHAIKIAHETLIDLIEDVPARTVPGVDRCLEILSGHIQRMEDMLRDLLDLSRVENSDQNAVVEKVGLNDIVRDLRQTLGTTAISAGVALELPDEPRTDAATMPSWLDTDRRLLMLALRNLLENGIKYNTHGGRVTLDICVGLDQQSTIFTITDTGRGIDPDHLDRIFERFYQVDAARTGTNARSGNRGTGLGLSIVKHAVGGLHGTISVESELGRGSVFTLEVPNLEVPATEGVAA
jgi:two-component system phosphate regulon sensor histidine kinase PhoR